MFDFVNKKRRVVQIILGLAMLPFVFWGLESYQGADGEDIVAHAAGEKIHREEFAQALRNQQESLRASMAGVVNDAMLDSPEVRSAVLEGLIQQRLLRHEASRVGLMVPDSQLIEMIQNIPAFQENGKFSKQRYEELLRGQGLSPKAFEARVRQELMRQQLIAPYSENGFISSSVAERVIRLGEEKREINVVQIQPEQFLAQVKPDDEAIKSYYDTHQAEFRLPEQVRVEYVVLSLDELINQSHVSDEEVTKYFNEHKDEFGQAEERRASHILISAPATASDAEKTAARTKAEQLADEIRKAPQRFEDLAREHSQDPGSAAKGGDLGFFPRNSMVKTFEDAVFQMKLDEISDVVEMEHGFHIIKLARIKGAEQVSLDKVRNQVEQEVKRQKAEKMFGEMAEGFGNIVYEQSDSLQPAAENFNLPVQKSEWIARDAGELPYFSNERLLEAIFSDDAIKDKRNTEAIEVSPNVLVAARVVDHRPASLPPVTALRDKIAGLIARQEAAKAAVNEGKEKLEQLQAGKDGIVRWGAAQQVSRTDPQGLDGEILRAIFKIEATELPSYTGVANSRGGFTLVRVGRVIESASPDPAERKAFAEQLQQLLAQQELASYLAGVRKRYDVSVKNENLEK